MTITIAGIHFDYREYDERSDVLYLPSKHEPIQLPPRTQVEVRDASGLPIAA